MKRSCGFRVVDFRCFACGTVLSSAARSILSDDGMEERSRRSRLADVVARVGSRGVDRRSDKMCDISIFTAQLSGFEMLLG